MDQTSALAACAAGCAAFGAAYRVLRPRFPIRVECWFCQGRQTVDYDQRNCFSCLECGQYNGFDADGGYNRDVRHLGRQELRFAANANAKSGNRENGLCHTCNLNQDLKVTQLAKFKPENPRKYEEEAREYEAYLEKTYRLCRSCEAVLHQTIGEQDAWIKPKLLSWRLESNRKRMQVDDKALSHNHDALWALFSVSSGLLALLGLQVASPVEVASAALAAWFVAAASKPQRSVLLCILAWMGIFMLGLLSKSKSNKDFAAFVMPAAQLVTFVASLGTLGLKKAKKSSSPKKSVVPKPATFNPTFHAATPSVATSFHSANTQSLLTSSSNNNDTIKDFDDDCNISTLSLDEEEEEDITLPASHNGRISPAFSIKSYNPVNNSGIDFGDRPRKARDLIRPAQFRPNKSPISNKGVVKASWVAGGYWQNLRPEDGKGSEDRSRASSQSSGFISQSGQSIHSQLTLPPISWPNHSKENSVCNERPPSVLSERFFNSSLNFSSRGGFPESGGSPFNRRGGPATSSSLNSSLCSEDLRKPPRAESSPIVNVDKKASLLDSKISINCSIYSLLLTVSFVVNVALCAYLAYNYL